MKSSWILYFCELSPCVSSIAGSTVLPSPLIRGEQEVWICIHKNSRTIRLTNRKLRLILQGVELFIIEFVFCIVCGCFGQTEFVYRHIFLVQIDFYTGNIGLYRFVGRFYFNQIVSCVYLLRTKPFRFFSSQRSVYCQQLH